MGYAVDYVPSCRRVKRSPVTSKKKRLSDIRRHVSGFLPRLMHDTVGVSTVSRQLLAELLQFGSISPVADPNGDHVIQQLIAEGVLNRPTRVHGRQVFDRDDVVKALSAWAA